MSKYTRKKPDPVDQPDEFLDFWTRVFEAARPYARAIGWSLVGFVVVLVGGIAGTELLEHRAEGATEAYGRAMRTYEAELATDDTAKDADKDNAVPRFKTSRERAEATLAELDKLPPTAKKNARMFRAGILFDLERFDEARAAYADAEHDLPPALRVVAREGQALCLEQAGKLDEALAAYAKVAPDGDAASAFYRDHVLLGTARLLEKKGDKAGAIAQYKELIDKLPTSALLEEAQNRLAVLEGT